MFRNIFIIFFVVLLSACNQQANTSPTQDTKSNASSPVALSEQNPALPKLSAKTIHVIVALCDNKYQAIAPVPAKIGNGQDPKNNLYWGAAYGVKTFMRKQPQWELIESRTKLISPILERLIFKHKTKNIYMIADAYDGQYINNATQDFLDFSAGVHHKDIPYKKQSLSAGGSSDLVVYIGHNLLMEYLTFNKPAIPNVDEQTMHRNSKRQAAVFACQSKKYFSSSLKNVGTRPLITTTTNMAPEAYSLNALVNGWADNKKPEQIHEDIAQAYHKYQKSGVGAARNLFALQ